MLMKIQGHEGLHFKQNGCFIDKLALEQKHQGSKGCLRRHPLKLGAILEFLEEK